MPFLKNERTNCAGSAKFAHEQQLLVLPGGLSWCINQHSCLHPIECHSTATNEERPLQHFCNFQGTLIIMNQILWHGTREQRHSLIYYPCKSLKTPNKLRTKISHTICDTEHSTLYKPTTYLSHAHTHLQKRNKVHSEHKPSASTACYSHTRHRHARARCWAYRTCVPARATGDGTHTRTCLCHQERACAC